MGMKRELVEVETAHVQVKDPLRKGQGDLTTLENSIRNLGLLQPILVDSRNVLVAGGRRLQACRNVGMTTIPAIRLDVPSGSMTIHDIRADENLCREELSPDDLESLIQTKKKGIGSRGGKGAGGFFSNLKNMLSGK